MKKIKNFMTILLVFCMSIIILSGSVSAVSTNIRTSASKVTVGKTVSITVSFGEAVAAAQFAFNYDQGKFDYVSCSTGSENFTGSMFAWFSPTDTPTLSSVTFTFKAKATGTGKFSISNLIVPNKSNNIGTSSVNVTVANQTSSSNGNTNNKPKVTPTPSPDEQNPNTITKSELDAVEAAIIGLIESDYTPESWQSLQEAIQKGMNATTQEEYDSIKTLLTINNLEIAEFEKPELNQLLRDLMGKSQDKYTEDSWQSLQNAIELADNAKLLSEYEILKDRLSIDTLVEKEEGSSFDKIVDFFQGLDEQERISLALGV